MVRTWYNDNADQAWAQWALEAFLQLLPTLTSADMSTQHLTGLISVDSISFPSGQLANYFPLPVSRLYLLLHE